MTFRDTFFVDTADHLCAAENEMKGSSKIIKIYLNRVFIPVGMVPREEIFSWSRAPLKISPVQANACKSGTTVAQSESEIDPDSCLKINQMSLLY